MKKLFKILFSLLTALTLSGIVYSHSFENTDEVINNRSSETIECKYDQCHATAKSTGKRCKHCVSNKGDKYCWQHE